MKLRLIDISTVFFCDDLIETPEGVCLFETKADMIKAYGGETVVVGDGYKANEVAVVEREKTAKRMSEEMDNAFFPNQADNFDNRSAYTNTLAKELVNELEVDIPSGMIETEVENMLRDMEQRMSYQGLKMEQYLKILNKTVIKRTEKRKR